MTIFKKGFPIVQSIGIVFFVVVIIVLTMSISGFLSNKKSLQPERIKEAIESACVECYALEGSYPPDLDYLAAHYGIILDKERYYYYYEAFASNIMPEVEVYEKGR